MMKRRTMTIAGLSIAAVITGGALAAGALPALAETMSATSVAATTADAAEVGHEANGVLEAELTSDAAAQVEAAVRAAYPGVTIERLENDAEGAAYEAHIVQADGARATVQLDGTYAVTGLETGGPGHGPRHEAEEALTGETATQVEAAVLAAYPDVTIQRLESDDDGTYEARILQTDGTRAKVTLDAAFTVTGLETGAHGHSHGHGHGPRDDADGDDSGAEAPGTEVAAGS